MTISNGNILSCRGGVGEGRGRAAYSESSQKEYQHEKDDFTSLAPQACALVTSNNPLSSAFKSGYSSEYGVEGESLEGYDMADDDNDDDGDGDDGDEAKTTATTPMTMFTRRTHHPCMLDFGEDEDRCHYSDDDIWKLHWRVRCCVFYYYYCSMCSV